MDLSSLSLPAVILLAVSSITLLLSHTWRWRIGALGFQYLGVFNGLITTGAFLELALKPNPVKTFLGNTMSKYLPFISLPEHLNSKDLTADVEIQNSYDNDPLMHYQANARWFTECLNAQEKSFDDADRLEIPLLIMHGGDDKVAAPEGSHELVRKAGSKNKRLIIYDDMMHEILNELDKKKVYDNIIAWLKAL